MYAHLLGAGRQPQSLKWTISREPLNSTVREVLMLSPLDSWRNRGTEHGNCCSGSHSWPEPLPREWRDVEGALVSQESWGPPGDEPPPP